MWPDLPRFRAAHAAGALGDLAAGCDVVFGPAIDGGLYLVGISRPLPELFALPEQTWRHDAMGVALTAIRDVGYEVGILRAERALHRPADLRAALADPLLPGDMATILRVNAWHGLAALACAAAGRAERDASRSWPAAHGVGGLSFHRLPR